MRRMTIGLVAMLVMACGGAERTSTRQPAQVAMLAAYNSSRPNVVMVGSDKPFSGVTLTFSSPAVSAQYGGALAGWYRATLKVTNYFGAENDIALTDGTNAFRQNGNVTWTAPSDWVPGYWVDATDPGCDDVCKSLDRSLYWIAIELPTWYPSPYDWCAPGYTGPCDAALPAPQNYDPTPPAYTVATVELL